MSATLDQLRGEVGLTGLSVWGAARAFCNFRVREVQPRLFYSPGGLLYDPLQSPGGCRPLATMPEARSLLPQIAQTCERHELAMRLLLSTALMGGLAENYPEFASRNAFDDVSRLSVCLLNSSVQDCMAGLTRDLPPQFSVSQIILHDFRVGWLEAFDCDVRWPSPPGSLERLILSTCFCPACVKSARETGVDADEARKVVQNLVQKSMAHGTAFGGSLAGFLAEQPSLAAYKGVQTELLQAFLRKIVADCRMEVFVARQASGSGGSFEPFDDGVPAGIIIQADDVTQLANQRVSAAKRSEVTLPASELLGPRAEDFIAAMSRLCEWGYSGVQIDDYGALPDSAFTTLKQAIRFARRSAGS